MTREGPFWEAVEGRAPLPPAAVILGWELVAINPEEGTIEVAFTAKDLQVSVRNARAPWPVMAR